MCMVPHRPSDLLLLNIKAAISNLEAEITRQRTNNDTDIRQQCRFPAGSAELHRVRSRVERRHAWLADLQLERDALRADYDWLLSLRADAVTVK